MNSPFHTWYRRILPTLGISLWALFDFGSRGTISLGSLVTYLLDLRALTLAPYVLLAVASFWMSRKTPLLLAGSIVFLLDLYFQLETYVFPSSSTSSLILLWGPLWQTLIFAPGMFLIGWGLSAAYERITKGRHA